MAYAVPEESSRQPTSCASCRVSRSKPPGLPDNDLHEDDHGPEAKSSIMTVCTSGFSVKKMALKTGGALDDTNPNIAGFFNGQITQNVPSNNVRMKVDSPIEKKSGSV